MDSLLYYKLYIQKCATSQNELKYNINTIYQQRFQNLKMFSQFNSMVISVFKRRQFICTNTRRFENYISIWHLSFWLQNCQTCIGSTKAANSHPKSATIRLLLISWYWKKGFANPSMLFHMKYCITIY